MKTIHPKSKKFTTTFLFSFFFPLLILGIWEKEVVNHMDPEASGKPENAVETLDLYLSPADGSYQTITVEQMRPSLADDYDGNLSTADIVIIRALSDEAEDDPNADDGSTKNDIVIASDCKSIQLRKERVTPGNGRVYIITLVIDDGVTSMGAEFTAGVPYRYQFGSPLCDYDAENVTYSVDGCIKCADELPQLTNAAGLNFLIMGSRSWGYNSIYKPYPQTGATSETDGQANTQKIIDAYPDVSDNAAKLCDNLVYMGCDDWYLPAIGEMKQIYREIGDLNTWVETHRRPNSISSLYVNYIYGYHTDPYYETTEFELKWFWSSTSVEGDGSVGNKAKTFLFADGGITNSTHKKYESRACMCVRKAKKP